MPNYTRRPIAERFWPKVDKDGPVHPVLGTRCWLWTGARLHRDSGHGTLSRGRSHILAHRLSYELHIGSIPDGLDICHRCDNPPCVNPEHLFPGTHRENMADCIAKGRSRDPINGIVNRAKTHCLRGHEFTPANTYRINGQRRCRACCRDTMRRRRAARGPRPPSAGAVNRVKTHCPHGHEFTPENTYKIGPQKKWRACRACHIAYQKRAYAESRR